MMGFGCLSPFTETYDEAIKLGYRHFDTAFIHMNHHAVGEAIRNSRVPREEIFLTTKVSAFPPSNRCCFGLLELPKPITDPDIDDPRAGAGTYAKGRELEGVRLALQELGLDYIDLCLIHRPAVTALEMQAIYVPHYQMLQVIDENWLRHLLQRLLNAAIRLENIGSGREAARAKRAEAWRQMEEAKRLGLCKHIGVSNYPLGALQEMELYAQEMPQVIQMEITPICQWPAMLEYAKRRNIAVTGYGTSVSKEFVNMVDAGMAERMGRTTNEIVLRWRLQRGVGVLQGSMNPEHMKDNLEVLNFELQPSDMMFLDSLSSDFPFFFDLSYFDARDDDLLMSVLVVATALGIGAMISTFGCCFCCCLCRPCRREAAASVGGQKKNA